MMKLVGTWQVRGELTQRQVGDEPTRMRNGGSCVGGHHAEIQTGNWNLWVEIWRLKRLTNWGLNGWEAGMLLQV